LDGFLAFTIPPSTFKIKTARPIDMAGGYYYLFEILMGLKTVVKNSDC
jgi:hypothetical protein